MEKRFGVISADGHCRLMIFPSICGRSVYPEDSRRTGREFIQEADGFDAAERQLGAQTLGALRSLSSSFRAASSMLAASA